MTAMTYPPSCDLVTRTGVVVVARRPSDCSELDGTTFLRCAPGTSSGRAGRRILGDFVGEGRLREGRYLRRRCGHEPLEPLGDAPRLRGRGVTNHRVGKTNARDPRGGHWGKDHKAATQRYIRRSTREQLHRVPRKGLGGGLGRVSSLEGRANTL